MKEGIAREHLQRAEERSGPGSGERREVFAGLPGGPGLDEEPLEVSDELLDAFAFLTVQCDCHYLTQQE